MLSELVNSIGDFIKCVFKCILGSGSEQSWPLVSIMLYIRMKIFLRFSQEYLLGYKRWILIYGSLDCSPASVEPVSAGVRCLWWSTKLVFSLPERVFVFVDEEELFSVMKDADCLYCRIPVTASKQHLKKRHLRFAIYYKDAGIGNWPVTVSTTHT